MPELEDELLDNEGETLSEEEKRQRREEMLAYDKYKLVH
jgi:predicted nucleic acid-binding Zn ribbon protein